MPRLAEVISAVKILIRPVTRVLFQHIGCQDRSTAGLVTRSSAFLAVHCATVSSFQSLGVHHHQYTDDIQIYISASGANLAANIDLLESCTASVLSSLLHNGLQLNPTKSELIQFTSGRDRVNDVYHMSRYATLSSSRRRQ